MSNKLYIGNLPYNTSEGDLEGLFKPYGEVTAVNVIRDKFTGKSKGFAFVEMANADAANSAISSLDGSELDGRNIRVNLARERTERSGSNGGSRRGGGGGGFKRNDRW